MWRRVWPLAAALCALGVCAPGVGAQTPPPAFRSAAELVVLQVSVTDGRRHFVADLRRDDFAVLEEGAPQDLTLFASADAPLDLMLLLDGSASMHQHLRVVREAAINFIRRLRQGDRASVVVFSDRVRVAEPLTGEPSALEAAIRNLTPAGNTALYDALYISLRELTRVRHGDDQQRRQAVVVLSDGDDTSSRMAFDDVLGEARRSAVTVFSITPLARPSQWEVATRPKAATDLRQLAEETGGRAFAPLRLEDLAGVYGEIADELGQQYWLAYTPRPAAPGFRRISVRVVTHPALRTRTRSGYYVTCRNRIETPSACR